MIPSEGLIDKYGPLIIVAIAAYNLLPYLVKEVMGVVTHITQSHAKVAEAPYEALKTLLSNTTRDDLMAIELIGIRASQARIEEHQGRIEESLSRFLSMFEEFLKSNKEKKP